MNPFSSWICTNTSKNLFVKVVHPGGRIELYNRPVEAAELLQRHPKCCVAHPTVFQQPYNIVSPTTTLVLGQKYYVVPVETIRKLQLKLKHTALEKRRDNVQLSNDHHHKQKSRKIKDNGDDHKKVESTHCCLLKRNSNNKNGKNVGDRNGEGRVPVVALDHWQPGLESIREE